MKDKNIYRRFRNHIVSLVDEASPQASKICFLSLVFIETSYIYVKCKDLLREQWPVVDSASVPWMNFLSHETQASLATTTAWIAIVATAFLVAFIFKTWARIAFFCLLALVCTFDMFKTQGHAVHYFFWSFLPFAFVPNISRAWQWSLRFAQYLLMSTYFFSGMNKIASLPESFHTPDQVPFFFSIPYLIAHEYINTNKSNNALEVFATNQWLGAASILMVILLQVSVIVILFKPRYIPFYGVCFAFFHVANYLILGPDFLKVIPVVLSITVLPWVLDRMELTPAT